MPPGGHGAPYREAGVWAHADSPALCLLHSNTWSCPLLSGCSFAESCVLGIVSGIGESALHRVCMVGAATTRMDRSSILQALPWMLKVCSEAVQESHSHPCPLRAAPSRLHQLFLTQDTCKLRDILVTRLPHTH